MIISQKHKFIYLAIPKTASCSIEKALGKYHDTDITTLHNKHAPYNEIAEKLKDKGIEITDFFVFCFFRNPWDMMVSKYFYHKNDGCLEIAGIDVGKAAREMSFLDWVKIEKYRWICYDYPIKTMMEFIDFSYTVKIFKYEYLQDHFNNACTKIGIPCERLEKVNESVLRNHGVSYRDLYVRKGIYDPGAIAAVEDHFKVEIGLMGYEF